MTEARERNTLLKNLETAVCKHSNKVMGDLLDMALNASIPLDDIRHSIIQGLEQVRHKLMSNDISMADFLLCMDVVTEGLSRLSSLQEHDKVNRGDIPLVIGVVEGDPHDLGKNIIAGIYRAMIIKYLTSDVKCQRKSLLKAFWKPGPGYLPYLQ